MVYQHANEIFSLGRELMETVKGRPTGRPVRLSVGIADVVPKRVAYRLLEPALRLNEPIRFVCREDKPDPLLADLATHKLDIVIADSTIPTSVKVRAFNHLLGECGVSLLAAPDLARAHRRRFPRSLDGAPVLLPSDESAMRRSLDQWFVARNLRPAVVGEFDDTALAEAFAQAGVGIVAVPDVVEREVCNQYGLRIVGRLEGVRERFYAISVERKLKHPAVVAISEAARATLVL
jgi:LysR family transcriptional activator of nhaA